MDKRCTIFQTAEFIGKRWTILILLELYKGKDRWKRFTDLKESLPNITPKILSMRLKELEKQKLVEKRVDASSFPIKSEYCLTKHGLDFIKVIKEMKNWAIKWDRARGTCALTDCKECEF